MKQSLNRIAWVGATIALLAPGCSRHTTKEDLEKDAEAKRVKSVGDVMQRQGLMSSSEWTDFDRLDKLSGATKRLGDKDFYLLLKLMEVHKGTVSVSPSSSVVIVHVMAMDVFRNMTRATPEQRRKIVNASSILLNSPNQQESALAKQVISEFKG